MYFICANETHIMEDFKLPPFRINGNFAYFFDVIKHSIDRDMHLN